MLLNHNGVSNFRLPDECITGTHVTVSDNYVTESVEQIPSWKAERSSAGQELSRLF